MKIAHHLSVLVCLAVLPACGGDDKGPGSNAGTGRTENPSTGCSRATPAAEDNTTGGCRIRLVTPKPCEEIDLSAGKVYEFAWTTDGTNCETPYTAYLGGNPITRDADGTLQNVGQIQIPASDGEVSRFGGIARLKAGDLDGLTSSDGTYEWVIASFHGSHPASQVFKVKR